MKKIKAKNGLKMVHQEIHSKLKKSLDNLCCIFKINVSDTKVNRHWWNIDGN